MKKKRFTAVLIQHICFDRSRSQHDDQVSLALERYVSWTLDARTMLNVRFLDLIDRLGSGA